MSSKLLVLRAGMALGRFISPLPCKLRIVIQKRNNKDLDFRRSLAAVDGLLDFFSSSTISLLQIVVVRECVRVGIDQLQIDGFGNLLDRGPKSPSLSWAWVTTT